MNAPFAENKDLFSAPERINDNCPLLESSRDHGPNLTDQTASRKPEKGPTSDPWRQSPVFIPFARTGLPGFIADEA
jgi:hypothetical protein